MTLVTGELLVALVAVAAVALPATRTAAADDAKLRADLDALSRRSVFFGHQSVGENLVEGLQRLEKAQGKGPKVERLDAAAAGRIAPGTFAHALVPRNGEPLLKLQSFERELDARGGVDLALVKLCYVDVTPNTDARALFDAYQAALARLEAKHPDTTFVRVTIPLHTVQRGPKAVVKKLVGRTTGVAENARREEFNELLRGATRGKAPLFDVALVESTRPDGQAETEPFQGKPVRVMSPAWTTDGGHLNDAGKDRAARELVSVLAAAPLRRAATPQ